MNSIEQLINKEQLDLEDSKKIIKYLSQTWSDLINTEVPPELENDQKFRADIKDLVDTVKKLSCAMKNHIQA